MTPKKIFLHVGSSIYGTINTAAQHNITSVTTLNITGGNETNAGLSLAGALVTANATELNYLDGSVPVTASANNALVLDATKSIEGISDLTATNLTGTIQTPAQANITSVGTLTSLVIAGDLTMGSAMISSTDILKIDAITNGAASADKALVLDANKSISGITSIGTDTIAIGSPANTNLPAEIGYVTYQTSLAYAYMNESNAHGMADAGMDVSANYSLRTDGRILCQGEIEITSDKRLKENVIELTQNFHKKFIMSTTPVKFNWKNSDEIVDYGYTAQDVIKAGFNDLVTIVPELGMEGSVEEDGLVNPMDAEFVFSPGKIIPMLALNQPDAYEQLDVMDKKINELEERLAKPEATMAKFLP